MITRRSLMALAALAGAAGLSGCDRGQTSDGPVTDRTGDTPLDPAAPQPRPAAVDFSAQLFEQLTGPGENTVCSPTSALLALGMLRSGALGEVAEQLDDLIDAEDRADWEAWSAAVLGALKSRNHHADDPPDEREVQLLVANGIFTDADEELNPDYLDRLASVHAAQQIGVDFTEPDAAAQTINAWAAEHTAGRIEKVVDPQAITPELRFILADALHLAAQWSVSFDPEQTSDQQFTLVDGSTIQTPMMFNETGQWYEDRHVEATRIQISGDELGMIVALPKDDPARLAEHWSKGGLVDLFNEMERYHEVQLTMPKWSFNFGDSLNEALSAVGLGALFEPGADLSDIGPGPWQVDGIFQRALISVDEYGLVASAVTTIAPAGAAPNQPPPKVLVCDRPFFFVVYDIAMQLPLFIGQVADPSQTA